MFHKDKKKFVFNLQLVHFKVNSTLVNRDAKFVLKKCIYFRVLLLFDIVKILLFDLYKYNLFFFFFTDV